MEGKMEGMEASLLAAWIVSPKQQWFKDAVSFLHALPHWFCQHFSGALLKQC